MSVPNEKVLELFLKKHRLYSAYVKNVSTMSSSLLTRRRNGFETNIASAIGFAFDWCDTPQGQDKWEEVHGNWLKMCVDLKLDGQFDARNLDYRLRGL